MRKLPLVKPQEGVVLFRLELVAIFGVDLPVGDAVVAGKRPTYGTVFFRKEQLGFADMGPHDGLFHAITAGKSQCLPFCL